MLKLVRHRQDFLVDALPRAIGATSASSKDALRGLFTLHGDLSLLPLHLHEGRPLRGYLALRAL
ncbi:hypothetical protein ACFJIS_17765 [Variovorax boronicumulans]|uniref:hypothetical protein n=1 Tax=Variovorax boronicumulans TaxID=436515 RepID=UPI0036F41076